MARVRFTRILLAACLALFALPAVALAGGDEGEESGPPVFPPPGMAEPPEGDHPFNPSTAEPCGIRPMRYVGPGKLLGVYVDHVGCRFGLRLVHRYQRCLDRRSDKACFDTIDWRCVQPEFLGRCRDHDYFYIRRIAGFRCIERRLYEIGKRYNGNVFCFHRKRRISLPYTLFMSPTIQVGNESDLRAAWANPLFTEIDVTRDIVTKACRFGDPIRESSTAILVDGQGHTLRNGCFEKRLLRQDGTGFVELRNITLTRGGSDGPGAALSSRGEITLVDTRIHENLSEEPGGGVMSQRRVTAIRCVITGNLANDDGGGIYARRGGIQVYDSIISANLVDGSGGALGSTGDILVVNSHIDGNTTDGDGGAIYTDEDGDITVINSTVNGSDADGPGGAIFTLDGDVTIIGSTLNGNRADDRGGAISGEADVTIVNSTIARNAAVAHVAGGVWARGSVYVANSTISGNYAEGQGGGILASGVVGLVNSTVTDNIAPVSSQIGAGEVLETFGSVIGPTTPKAERTGGFVQPTGPICQMPRTRSYGYNVATDATCGLNGPGDLNGIAEVVGPDGVKTLPPLLAPLDLKTGIGETHMPMAGSPLIDRIPTALCQFKPLGEIHEGEMHIEGLVDYPAIAIGRDQRGVPRPQGGGCDTGAVELGG
jgi:predicted outer membrane repeat protein